ncbi:histidine acid phosphatase [Cercophora scortea]|uniref:Histidine acid phosphatase n=1 Tax=Cercophora scortea TaxID=314031 RepID=A0AAE0IAT0_9PEZI|nr:histidine acid phosphatase [Cercophora scortea]
MRHGGRLLVAVAGVGAGVHASPISSPSQEVDLSWHAPAQTQLNNLTAVLTTEGVPGFFYNSSDAPDGKYGAYTFCNMPHVRRAEYVVAPSEYELVFVEVLHRHHKRTPYASTSFPIEPYTWDCDGQQLFFYGQTLASANSTAHPATPAYWKGYTSSLNPFHPYGWRGTCQFPQITSPGLADSWQHGADLYEVYHSLLNFLPPRDDPHWRNRVVYRVTANPITSQVAGMVINGMWNTTDAVPLLIETAAIDSLEPHYPCPAATKLFDAVRTSDAWKEHLRAAEPLFAKLDMVSGVPRGSSYHDTFDGYFDNLQARMCHQLPLPCREGKGCITQEMADAVCRFGNWEYSRIYRDDQGTFEASAASFGVWIADLAGHLRRAMNGEGNEGGMLWVHNVAHDGTVSRLLSVLQIDEMFWPGMGSEVVFELFRMKEESGGGYFVRVLFGGRVFKSSNPNLGVIDLIPVERLLAYFDGLVGQNATLVASKCGVS